MWHNSYGKTFQITRFGIPIEEFQVINSINTGIEFDAFPGYIPKFLEVQVAKEYHYTYFGTWQDLTPQQQSFLIAHYIATSYVEQHKADAEAREIKKQQAKNKAKK